MNNQEAIENMKISVKAYENNLREIGTVNSINKDWDGVSAIGQPISTDDKIYKYTVGNLEAAKLAIEALEKQIPKKPIRLPWSISRCPSCSDELGEWLKDGYHKDWENLKICDCGQKLDWSVEE